MDAKRCIIFAGGRPEPYIPKWVDTENSFVIAADKGYKNCKKLGLTPDVCIGDFDSLGFVPEDCEHIRFPKEKDDTDLMLAVREAIARGCADITILGATGGRLDHMMANIQTLAFIRSEGAWGRIAGVYEEIMLLSAGEYTFAKRCGFSLSVFSYSPSVDGLTMRGVKYPTNGISLSHLFPLGISNEIIADSAQISFEKGLLLVIRSKL